MLLSYISRDGTLDRSIKYSGTAYIKRKPEFGGSDFRVRSNWRYFLTICNYFAQLTIDKLCICNLAIHIIANLIVSRNQEI